jgi:hypothetical protein
MQEGVCVDESCEAGQHDKPQAEHDYHITYLELGLGMAGAFFPFSPFPSYPFPKVVVLDMLRDDVRILLENDTATQNGLEI